MFVAEKVLLLLVISLTADDMPNVSQKFVQPDARSGESLKLCVVIFLASLSVEYSHYMLIVIVIMKP